MDAKEQLTASILARADFYFFARYMFKSRAGSTWLRAPHHAKICQALTKVFEGQTRRLIINIPPRYSKTELAVVMWIAWCLGRVPDAEFIHTSYSAGLASSNSANILRVVESQEYQAVFPKTALGQTARAHWKTTAGGVMYATGSSGTLTGFGAGKERKGFGGAIVIDDPHKADEARSDTMRAAVIDWYQQTLQSRVNSRNTPIILIMQRLHEKDLAGWLLDGGSGEEWESLILPAVQEDGTALWPEKHTVEELQMMERANPYGFAGQYLQRPSPPEGGMFKPDQIEIIDTLPAVDIDWCRGWDLAASVGGDYTAGAKVGVAKDGRVFIGDMARMRAAPDERDAALKNIASQDGRKVRISIPQDPGQAGLTLVTYLVRMLGGYPVHTSPESGSKETRAEPFASQVNVGNVKMLRGPWNAELLNEMRMFPNGTHDDQVDACSRAYSRLAEPAPVTSISTLRI